MVLVCVGSWVGACARVVWSFAFGSLGWGGQSGGVKGGLDVSTATHQERKIPKNRRKTETRIE